jgi:ATP-dependent exoDNAse (exonuclease V) beta subunit
VDDIVAEAVTAWRRLRSRKDVVSLLVGDRLLHEVPFSMSIRSNGEPVVLRGVIDCLVQKNDGSILVVEFKTGRPRPSHQRQLDLYVDAAMAIYPGARIEGRLVYAD